MKLIQFGVEGDALDDTIKRGLSQPDPSTVARPAPPAPKLAVEMFKKPAQGPAASVSQTDWNVYMTVRKAIGLGQADLVHPEWWKTTVTVASKIGQPVEAQQYQAALDARMAKEKAAYLASRPAAPAATAARASAPQQRRAAPAARPAARPPAVAAKRPAPTPANAVSAAEMATYNKVFETIKNGGTPAMADLDVAAVVAVRLGHKKSSATIDKYVVLGSTGVTPKDLREYAQNVTTIRENGQWDNASLQRAIHTASRLSSRPDILGYVPGGMPIEEWIAYLTAVSQVSPSTTVAELQRIRELAAKAGHAKIVKVAEKALVIKAKGGPASPNVAVKVGPVSDIRRTPNRPLQPPGSFPQVTDAAYTMYSKVTEILKRNPQAKIKPASLQIAQNVAHAYGHTETNDVVLAKMKDAGIPTKQVLAATAGATAATAAATAAAAKKPAAPGVDPALLAKISPGLRKYAAKPPKPDISVSDWVNALVILSAVDTKPTAITDQDLVYGQKVFQAAGWPKAHAKLAALAKKRGGAPAPKPAAPETPPAAESPLLAQISPGLRKYASKSPKPDISLPDWQNALVIYSHALKAPGSVNDTDINFARAIFKHAAWPKAEANLAKLVEKKAAPAQPGTPGAPVAKEEPVSPAILARIAPSFRKYAGKVPNPGMNLPDWQRALVIYSQALKEPKILSNEDIDYARGILLKGGWPKADAKLAVIQKARGGAPTVPKKGLSPEAVAAVAVPAAVLALIAPGLRQYAGKPPAGIDPADWQRALIVHAKAAKGTATPEELAFAKDVFKRGKWPKAEQAIASVEAKQQKALAQKQKKNAPGQGSPLAGKTEALAKAREQERLRNLAASKALAAKAAAEQQTKVAAEALKKQELAQAKAKGATDPATKQAALAEAKTAQAERVRAQAQARELDARKQHEQATATAYNKELEKAPPEVKEEVKADPAPAPEIAPHEVAETAPTPPPGARGGGGRGAGSADPYAGPSAGPLSPGAGPGDGYGGPIAQGLPQPSGAQIKNAAGNMGVPPDAVKEKLDSAAAGNELTAEQLAAARDLHARAAANDPNAQKEISDAKAGAEAGNPLMKDKAAALGAAGAGLAAGAGVAAVVMKKKDEAPPPAPEDSIEDKADKPIVENKMKAQIAPGEPGGVGIAIAGLGVVAAGMFAMLKKKGAKAAMAGVK